MFQHLCFSSGRVHGWSWGVRLCSPEVFTANWGRFTVIQRQFHQAMEGSLIVPNKRWCPQKELGMALMAFPWLFSGQTTLKCGCAGVSGLVLGTRLILTYTNSGESPALCNDRGHLCAQGSTVPGAPSERISVQLCFGAVPRAWQAKELHQSRQPFPGDPVGFT